MTFTIVARNPKTKELGICLATSPLGVASRCPHVRSGVAAISSQCHTNWKLGLIGLDLAANGLTPEQILKSLQGYDPFFDYRQVGIVDIEGRTAAYSPPKGAAYTGHKVGDGFVAMGNGLAGPQVVDAIYDGFRANADQDFAEQLVRSIEAGYHAGGERIGQKSAGLIVSGPGSERPLVDLRIDMANPLPEDGGDAVKDLRRVFDAYKPLIPYYADYWLTHPTVKWAEWRSQAA
jgi:uncharacterized Ntn-hydrolase superfamily protein